MGARSHPDDHPVRLSESRSKLGGTGKVGCAYVCLFLQTNKPDRPEDVDDLIVYLNNNRDSISYGGLDNFVNAICRCNDCLGQVGCCVA